jgi:putative transposase
MLERHPEHAYTTFMRFTSFSLLLQPTPEQLQALRRHGGAARFAYNVGLRLVQQALEARTTDRSAKVPWSGFDLINAFNRWKMSPAAGVNERGEAGLPWRKEVCAQVFEEAVVDLGRGLKAFSESRKAGNGRIRFPCPKKKGRSRVSFRLRNKRGGIRIGVDHVHLPFFGSVRVRESTRNLRRVLRSPEGREGAKILFATITERANRWYVRLNVQAAPFHSNVAAVKIQTQVVGIDRGLKTFAVAAISSGEEVWRQAAPMPLRRELRRLRHVARAHSRKAKGSANRRRAADKLARLHARIRHVRLDHTHKLSSHVAKTHSCVALENLNIAGMLRCHSLARSIADSCWGEFSRQLQYKGQWYRCPIYLVDRFAPTSKACCRCGEVIASLSLADRVFVCPSCGWQADRDTNAAANCAIFVQTQSMVAGKQPETLNARGGGSSGRQPYGGETALDEARRVSAA